MTNEEYYADLDAKVFRIIWKAAEAHGMTPTGARIAERLNMGSYSVVYRSIARLQAAGRIICEGTRNKRVYVIPGANYKTRAVAIASGHMKPVCASRQGKPILSEAAIAKLYRKRRYEDVKLEKSYELRPVRPACDGREGLFSSASVMCMEG